MGLLRELSDTVAGRFSPERFADRRVIVLNSATHSHLHVSDAGLSARREVIVNASYTGVYCAKLINEIDPLGVIGIDCGIGKDGAGIAGLWYFEALGTPAAAVDVMTVELGNGRDLWTNGVISRTNWVAQSVGVRAGMLASEAAAYMLRAPDVTEPPDAAGRHVVAHSTSGRAVVAMNSITDALPADRDTNVLCTAGHTGRGEIDYIIRAAPFGFISSDGGRGKNDSGIGALAQVNEAGIAGAAVSAQTARMGDGMSTYFDGIISAANDLAVTASVRIGMTASEAAQLLLER